MLGSGSVQVAPPSYSHPYGQWEERHSGVMKFVDPEMVEFVTDLGATTVQAIEKGLKDARIVPGQEISPRAAAVRNEIVELVTARMALMLSNLIVDFDSFAFNARARGRKE